MALFQDYCEVDAPVAKVWSVQPVVFETSVALDALTAAEVTTAIGQVFALRKELATYNNNFAIKESIKPAIPTLFSPTNSPKLDPTFD